MKRFSVSAALSSSDSAARPASKATPSSSAMASQRSKNTGKQLVAKTAAEHPVQTLLHFPGLRKPCGARHFAKSAEQPVTGSSSAIDDSSAARPAPQLHRPVRPRSLQDCTDWLNGLSHLDMTEDKPVQRLQSATSLLQGGSSRQQRQEIQKLLDAWDVPQKAQGRKRKYEEVKAALVEKVLEEGHRLQMLQDTSPTHAQAPFSAIREAFQHASIQRSG